MDGNLANAGAAEGGTMEGADRRGESCQSQIKVRHIKTSLFYLTVVNVMAIKLTAITLILLRRNSNLLLKFENLLQRKFYNLCYGFWCYFFF